jgi:hypothetical protein
LSEDIGDQKSSTLTVEMLETHQGMGQGTHVMLSETAMEKLGLFAGDILEISGRRKTVATCLPERFLHMMTKSTPSTEGENVIRLNDVTRANANVRLGDQATIKRVEAILASKVTLLPLGSSQGAVVPKDMQRNSGYITFVIGDNLFASSHRGRQLVKVVGATSSNKIMTNTSHHQQREKTASDDIGDNKQLAPYVVWNLRTEFEVLDPGGWSAEGISKRTRIAQESTRSYPAYWHHVGLGGRMDPLSDKYLALSLMVSSHEGSLHSSFEVKTSEQRPEAEQEAFDIGKMLQGLQAASRTGVKPELQKDQQNFAMRMIQRTMGFGRLGDLYSNSGAYIEVAARIVDAANIEDRFSGTRVTPDELMHRILTRWLTMKV